jgi:hypothetical protein
VVPIQNGNQTRYLENNLVAKIIWYLSHIISFERYYCINYGRSRTSCLFGKVCPHLLQYDEKPFVIQIRHIEINTLKRTILQNRVCNTRGKIGINGQSG